MRPVNAVTVLDTHDGIGVADVAARSRPSPAPGLLPAEEIAALVATIHDRSGGASRLASGSGAANVDASQINCTFYDALGRRDAEYLIARAIQCFVPGVPQIYYVGLLAGGNDLDLLRRTGVGRDVNRHYYTPEELRDELTRPVVRSLMALLRLRTTTPRSKARFTWLVRPRPYHPRSGETGSDTARLDGRPDRDGRRGDDHGAGRWSRGHAGLEHDGGDVTMARDSGRNMTVVKTLTYLMFAMFAMTTDSVGLIIPEVIRTFGLSLTAAGTFQYATMAGIAVAALLFGQLADRLGRRPTIIVGLVLFASACFLMVTGDRLTVFAILLGLSGVAIGVFKTGALALIGDISTSTPSTPPS
jgi:uncharacterized membrane protein